MLFKTGQVFLWILLLVDVVQVFRPGRFYQNAQYLLVVFTEWTEDCNMCYKRAVVMMRHPPSLPQRSSKRYHAVSCHTSDTKSRGQV
jgi:hypothetical protein